MKKIQCGIILAIFINVNGNFFEIDVIKNILLQWKSEKFFDFKEVGALTDGILDLSDIKNKFLQWKNTKLSALCPSNGAQLQNLLNIACSTAQSTNITARDACISCFTRVTSLPEGPQELSALSVCASQYFVNTTYAICAMNLMALSNSALNVQTAGCYNGYCDFVQCVRRINSDNLIIQCTRESRTGVNISLDADNLRFYKNVTSCILAKSRCGTYNPITGAPQTPGFLNSNQAASNTLQITAAGNLRVMAFSAYTPITPYFCPSQSNLTQSSWLTNVC